MKNRIVAVLLPALIIILGVGGIGVARNCHQFFQQVVAQPVYAQPYYAPQVYYSVGQDLQTEALAEKVAALVESKLAQRAQATYGGKQEYKGAPTQAPPPGAEGVPAPPAPGNGSVAPSQTPNSALAQHCKKCHSGAAPKAGLVFDGITDLKCSEVTAALRQIASNKMPKDHQIDGPTKGALMGELLDLEILPVRAEPPPPVPTPDLE